MEADSGFEGQPGEQARPGAHTPEQRDAGPLLDHEGAGRLLAQQARVEAGVVVRGRIVVGACGLASPVAADEKIFMASELGKVAVLSPGSGLNVVAVNDLDDLIYATPAIADGRLYIRTRNTLYCFGKESD